MLSVEVAEQRNVWKDLDGVLEIFLFSHLVFH